MNWFLVSWLACGVLGFFLARAAWHWKFGCHPITVGTICMLLIAMWVPPFTFLAAIVWSIIHMAEGGGFKFLQYEIVNPCKWLRRDR